MRKSTTFAFTNIYKSQLALLGHSPERPLVLLYVLHLFMMGYLYCIALNASW